MLCEGPEQLEMINSNPILRRKEDWSSRIESMLFTKLSFSLIERFGFEFEEAIPRFVSKDQAKIPVGRIAVKLSSLKKKRALPSGLSCVYLQAPSVDVPRYQNVEFEYPLNRPVGRNTTAK